MNAAPEVAAKAAEKLSVAHVSRHGFLAGAASGFARHKTGGDFMLHGIRYYPHLFVAIAADCAPSGNRYRLTQLVVDDSGR